jgi:hypothetical protein
LFNVRVTLSSLKCCDDISTSEKVDLRLKPWPTQWVFLLVLYATTTLLALAGVRPAEGVEEEKPASLEQQRPAVLLNLFLGSSEQPIEPVPL